MYIRKGGGDLCPLLWAQESLGRRRAAWSRVAKPHSAPPPSLVTGHIQGLPTDSLAVGPLSASLRQDEYFGGRSECRKS